MTWTILSYVMRDVLLPVLLITPLLLLVHTYMKLVKCRNTLEEARELADRAVAVAESTIDKLKDIEQGHKEVGWRG